MSVTEKKFCLRCFLRDCGRNETFKNISDRIKKLSDKDKSSDEEYKKRISVCSECEFLSEGTCLKCGCYPEFRAAFKKQNCPIKKW